MPRDCRRLAEVDFPIAVVSKHAAREKSIRHGHPSTLHLWWARRPLASSRAVLLTLLLPDPCDGRCPGAFKRRAGEILSAVRQPPKGDEAWLGLRPTGRQTRPRPLEERAAQAFLHVPVELYEVGRRIPRSEILAPPAKDPVHVRDDRTQVRVAAAPRGVRPHAGSHLLHRTPRRPAVTRGLAKVPDPQPANTTPRAGRRDPTAAPCEPPAAAGSGASGSHHGDAEAGT